MLQTHEMRLDQLNGVALLEVSGTSAQANLASYHRGYFGNNQSHGQHFSRGKGHGRSHYGGSDHGIGTGTRSRLVCQMCGHLGHIAIKCYHRFDISFTSQEIHSSPSQDSHAHLASATSVNDPKWYMDSGASTHITSNAYNFMSKVYYKGKEKVIVGNGSKLDISHVGSAIISTKHASQPLYLKNMLNVPTITKNLVSISQFTHDNDVFIEFYSTCCLVKDKKMKALLLEETLKDYLYQLDLSLVPSRFTVSKCISPVVYVCCDTVSDFTNKSSCNLATTNFSSCNSVLSCTNVNIWHQRFSYPHHFVLAQVLKLVKHSMLIDKTDFCSTCQYGNIHQMHFSATDTKTHHVLGIVHSNL